MGEGDWLERGHGGGDGLRPMIKGTVRRAADRGSIRNVLRGGEVRSPRRPRRRTKALVGWLLYCCTAVGGTAAAFTVRATLFPQLGGPSQALWVSPAPEVPLTTKHRAASTESPDTIPAAVEAALVAAAEAAGPGSLLAVQPVSASSPKADQEVVDKHGPSASAGPSTGTTVAQGPGGSHSTIVDENPIDTSNSGPGSSSVDPTSTTVSTPGSPTPTSTTTPVGDGGKGGGGDGGGGGGGSGGGGGGSDGGRTSSTTVPPAP